MSDTFKTFRLITAIAMLFIFLSSGCIQKHNDVFLSGENYQDVDPIKALMKKFSESLNKRDTSALMTCFDEKINFPDSFNNALKVTYTGLMYDYRDFFQKIESVNYEFNDQYIILSAHTAKVTMKLHKQYKAIAPFSHNVNGSVDENVTVTKNDGGEWKVTFMNELLPPRIY